MGPIISLRTELNEAELINIADARKWLSSRKRKILDPGFLNELHKRMFGDLWKWAGTYRTTARNIGIDAHRIPVELYHAIDNAKYWCANNTFPADVIAIRFSHRIVAIHPYPNGNGRFCRMIGDLLAIELGQPRFTRAKSILLIHPKPAKPISLRSRQRMPKTSNR